MAKKEKSNKEKKIKDVIKELEETRTALINMLEDVEEARKRAEEEKNKTLAIIRNFADGLLVFDAGSNLILINPQAEDFLRIKGEKIIGKTILELSKISALKSLIEILGKKSEEIFRRELEANKNLILEISALPIISEKEKLGVLVILHNITREKLIEKMKTEFVSLAAHQLRTPLSATKWTLKMLLDEDLGKIPKEQKEFLEGTYKSNEKMIALVNDLLNVTRIEEEKYLYQLILTDIGELVELVLNPYREEIEKRKIKIEFKKPAKKLPKTMIDVEKIKIAIDNIINNAITYTPTGGKVTISLSGNKEEIEFSVKDTGIGIPENQQERIFTKFFRGANATKMETEGTGLGLFIVKNIIEAHGGKTWFESKEGVGTTFYFNLPVKQKNK